MVFAKEMLETKKYLEKNGHEVFLPADTQDCVENPGLKCSFKGDLYAELKHCFAKDVLRDSFNKIEEGDAIIHLNYPKNGVDGYIGPAGLMEIGLAFHLKKKIFLINEVNKEQKYALEILLTKPVVLNGDLSRIN